MLNLSFLLQPSLAPNLIAKAVYNAISMDFENNTGPREPPVVEAVKERFDLIYSN